MVLLTLACLSSSSASSMRFFRKEETRRDLKFMSSAGRVRRNKDGQCGGSRGHAGLRGSPCLAESERRSKRRQHSCWWLSAGRTSRFLVRALSSALLAFS